MYTSPSPLLVVLTPVRNEAWVLRAFLEATSLWADYIIIADQMSTDGSREIAKEYPKVILIDNDRLEMHMAATRRLLFEEAKKIDGDKILFALDADEFLSGDFVTTADWQKILNSRPDDSFCWRWMNLKKDDVNQYFVGTHFYWGVHVSLDLWDGAFPDNFIHEWRLPWSPNADASHKFLLDDFYSIHLARVNQNRQRNKERFYQVSTIGQNPPKSMISLYRDYHAEESVEYFDGILDSLGKEDLSVKGALKRAHQTALGWEFANSDDRSLGESMREILLTRGEEKYNNNASTVRNAQEAFFITQTLLRAGYNHFDIINVF